MMTEACFCKTRVCFQKSTHSSVLLSVMFLYLLDSPHLQTLSSLYLSVGLQPSSTSVRNKPAISMHSACGLIMVKSPLSDRPLSSALRSQSYHQSLNRNHSHSPLLPRRQLWKDQLKKHLEENMQSLCLGKYLRRGTEWIIHIQKMVSAHHLLSITHHERS